MNSVINVVMIANAPAPYRVPGWQLINNMNDIEFNVIFCVQSIIDPTLNSDSFEFNSYFLQGKHTKLGEHFIHIDIKIWNLLNKLKPNIIITLGFMPSYLIAFSWAYFNKVPHIAMTDGTIQSEKSFSFVHKLLRRIVFRHSAAFVGASNGSLKLFSSYGVDFQRIHHSPLCVHNHDFQLPQCDKVSDFLFSGRFIDIKNPFFAIQVAAVTAKKLGRKVTLDMLGQGEMEHELRAFVETIKDRVNVRFLGYLAQRKLPIVFAQSRLFLFPTKFDCWGLVANEACAAGLPVLISPFAGAAGELVRNEVNGYVLELDVETWSNAAVHLLSNEREYSKFSHNSKQLVSSYTFEIAAAGLAAAIRQAAAKLN